MDIYMTSAEEALPAADELPAYTRKKRCWTIVAVAASMAVLLLAIAFDIGQVVITHDKIQAVADLASVDTAAMLDGGCAGVSDASSSTGQTLAQLADAQASASALRNDFNPRGGNVLHIVLGQSTPAGGFVAVANNDTTRVPNAVRITVGTPTPFFLSKGPGRSKRSATAVADLRRNAQNDQSRALPLSLGHIRCHQSDLSGLTR